MKPILQSEKSNRFEHVNSATRKIGNHRDEVMGLSLHESLVTPAMKTSANYHGIIQKRTTPDRSSARFPGAAKVVPFRHSSNPQDLHPPTPWNPNGP